MKRNQVTVYADVTDDASLPARLEKLEPGQELLIRHSGERLEVTKSTPTVRRRPTGR